jgi:cysteine synthase A
MLARNILDTIGRTPLVRINRLFDPKIQVYCKMENFNPSGSIKDRIALSMIEDAEKNDILNADSIIIEPTSGNTGVGLAMVAAVKGYKLILVMPESMSLERRRLMKAYGAQLELTPREKGIPGAIQKANDMVTKIPNAWMPMQFDNIANVKAHIEHTAAEILNDFHEGFDFIITGVGTGGHITGVDKVLKKKFPQIKTIAVEPSLSPVLSGGKPGAHPIQGLGAGFIPSILDTSILDGTVQITQEEAFTYTQRAAKEEGLFIGISSGASLAAVAQLSPHLPEGSKILTFSYDTGERYLSVEGLFI